MQACRVVLVRTQNPGNLGSVARAMRNLGTRDLVLVNPEASPADEQAIALATRHARDILQSARIVDSLHEALTDCVMSAGTSARIGGLYRRQSVLTLPEAAPRLVEAMQAGPVALVFGPERTGLENHEITCLTWQITIPTSEEYPVMNLAQSAVVCLWELRRTWLNRAEEGQPPTGLAKVASAEEQERMFEHLRRALTRVRYLRGGRANALFHGIRHLLARANPSPMEVRLLLGLARQLEYVAERTAWEEPE
ncbi:MAG: RNA methyltransferase [Gemmataceae bacterium]